MVTKREASASQALYLGRVSSTGWSVRVVVTQKISMGFFARLESRLICGLEIGCHLSGSCSILRPCTGCLIGVGQERR